jgi:hypothetical protein
MRFVRNQARLNCDLNTAYKSLTNQAKIDQWSNVVPVDIKSENQNAICWSVNIPMSNEENASSEGANLYLIEFNMMSCTESTEYCTEIHLITRFPGDERDQLDHYSKALLEKLRVHFNKSWVIQDKDLTLSSLKRSR